MDKYSYLSNATPEVIEELFKQYQQDPASVEIGWARFFEGFEFSLKMYPNKPVEVGDVSQIGKEFKVVSLINAYRQRGHLFTKTNPVRARRAYTPTLAIENFGLSNVDLKTVFQAGNEVVIGPATLESIITHLEAVYCHHIGVEFMYMREPLKIEWIKQKMDKLVKAEPYTKTQKADILSQLLDAVAFEKFLHRKFVGQKRFSLEGGESLIPALQFAILRGAQLGVKDVVLGMAHRGRVNVLANIFKKPCRQLFSEFEGKTFDESKFDGDVKYHLGYNARIQAGSHPVSMHLLPNPSHLEAVAPLVEGLSRAFIDLLHGKKETEVLPIVIHGDAAIAGQGIVYEVAQMSKLPGYKTGGTLHLVINNQVGFTTNYLEGRSSTYCTDVAKTVLAPVFHVNADDPEAVVRVIEIAMEYRQQFGEDVYVDLLGYRKHGHNEGDEPRFTQPLLYKVIDKHPDPYQLYKQRLLHEGEIDLATVELMEKTLNEKLEHELALSKEIKTTHIKLFLDEWYGKFKRSTIQDFEKSPNTGISLKGAKALLEKLNTLPEGKPFLKKVIKIFADRQKMVAEDRLDWALGESLAYASLLVEGHPIRLSGQDAVRGTFSHRHAILRVEDSEEEYCPLQHLEKNQARFQVYNSFLSEYGVLGFDYGYAFGSVDGLTLWEAQFGDFNNGAQIIIDQYISSAEDKWLTQNGLVMLLPHGYEGQGAEHSSARLERFLTLCAEMNIQVVNCTLPSNFFHVLRRQLARPFRKPLVVMSPKSLLRHPSCVSSLNEFTGKTGFREVIDDSSVNSNEVKKLVLCSGKFFYDLDKHRQEHGIQDTALVRLEQLYPFPVEQISAVFQKYGGAVRFVWAQEEPENMGAWSFIMRVIRKGDSVRSWEVAAQPASASPASGSPKQAAAAHQAVIEKVFS
jgi:2-oxoglutarate dehydrogenase E1 component